MSHEKIIKGLKRRGVEKHIQDTLEENEYPVTLKKSEKHLKKFVSKVIIPEIKPQATTKIGEMTGGKRKRSSAQIMEKAEVKGSIPNESESPIRKKKDYYRDSKGRFAKHEFHSAISRLSENKDDLLKSSNPVGRK